MGKKVLLLVLLAALALDWSIRMVRHAPGEDFYRFWAVPAARKIDGKELGSPYSRKKEYADALNRFADGSRDSKLRQANQARRKFDVAQTPLLYTCFALFPTAFSPSLTVHQTCQVLLFASAVVLLGLTRRGDPVTAVCLALVLVPLYGPLDSDLRLGNLGSFQLSLLAAALATARRIRPGEVSAANAGLGITLLCALSLLALMQPNTAAIALLLWAHFRVRNGPGLFAFCAPPALLFSALLVLLPCLYFGSWGVWTDWFGAVSGGRHATPAILNSGLGMGVLPWTAVLAVALAASAWKKKIASAEVFRDPAAVATIGVTLTAAVSPLQEYHGCVLILIPACLLIRRARRWDAPAVLALCAMVMASNAPGALLARIGLEAITPGSVAFCWIPLWWAIRRRDPSPGEP